MTRHLQTTTAPVRVATTVEVVPQRRRRAADPLERERRRLDAELRPRDGDEHAPHQLDPHDGGHHAGDGAGGLAKALRTVPVLGIAPRALLADGHRAVGLHNVALGLQRRFAALLGGPAVSVGLDHLTWERRVLVDGEDRLPDLLAGSGPAMAEEVELPVCRRQRLGMVPSSCSEAAVDLCAVLLGRPADDPLLPRANLRNDVTLPFVPDDAAVEGSASGGPAGVAALLPHPLVGDCDTGEPLTDAPADHDSDHLAWA